MKTAILLLSIFASTNLFASPEFNLVKNKYLGNNKFEVEFALKNTEDVLQVTLKKSYGRLQTPKLILKNDKLSFKTILDSQNYDEVLYDSVIVQYKDGSVDQLEAIEHNLPCEIPTGDEQPEVKDFINYKLLNDEAQAEVYNGVKLKSFKTTYEISFDTSTIDLSKYSGIIIGRNNLFQGSKDEEFFSDDSKELEKYLKSKKVIREVKYSQYIKGKEFICNTPIQELLMTGCLIDHKYPSKEMREVGGLNSSEYSITLVKKGDFSDYRFSTLKIPQEH